MQRHHHVKVFLLLAVFAAGGVLGPAMHYVEHAVTDGAVHSSPQQYERTQEPASEAMGNSAWLTQMDHAVASDLLCWFCQLAKTGKDPASTSAYGRAIVPVLVTGVPALSRVADGWALPLFVRGPPHRS